jgi:hypothetical protein
MFILIISRSFGRLGTARKLVEGNRKREWSLWCLGAALLSHVVGCFGIGYFDQLEVAWYALLAIIGVAVSQKVLSPSSEVQETFMSNHLAEATVNWDLVETNR